MTEGGKEKVRDRGSIGVREEEKEGEGVREGGREGGKQGAREGDLISGESLHRKYLTVLSYFSSCIFSLQKK